jgi:hypothetical protein
MRGIEGPPPKEATLTQLHTPTPPQWTPSGRSTPTSSGGDRRNQGEVLLFLKKTPVPLTQGQGHSGARSKATPGPRPHPRAPPRPRSTTRSTTRRKSFPTLPLDGAQCRRSLSSFIVVARGPKAPRKTMRREQASNFQDESKLPRRFQSRRVQAAAPLPIEASPCCRAASNRGESKLPRRFQSRRVQAAAPLPIEASLSFRGESELPRQIQSCFQFVKG